MFDLLDSLFVRLTSTCTVPLLFLELVVILFDDLLVILEFFSFSFPPEERLYFFLSLLTLSSITKIPLTIC